MTVDIEHGTWADAVAWSVPRPIPSDSPAVHVLYWVAKRETFEANEVVRSMRGRGDWMKSEKGASQTIRDALVELTEAGWITPVAEKLFVVHPGAKGIPPAPKARRRSSPRRAVAAKPERPSARKAPARSLKPDRTPVRKTPTPKAVHPSPRKAPAPKVSRPSPRKKKIVKPLEEFWVATPLDPYGETVAMVRQLFTLQADQICGKIATRAKSPVSDVVTDLERFRVQIFGEFEAAWSELLTDVITCAKAKEAGERIELKDRTRR